MRPNAYATEPGIGSVVVEDRGLWRRPRPEGVLPATRGRGIQLMRALADDTTIDTTAGGTRVSMSWGHLHLLQA